MSQLDNGIKQPLRFYDSLDKQNWQRDWVLDGVEKYKTLINPINTIIPFQIRRIASTNVITTFDLWKYNDVTGAFAFNTNVLGIIPAPQANHLFIVQMLNFDNIVWSPREEFTSDLECGYYYIHMSDGTVNWYSEVFHAVDDLIAVGSRPVNYTDDSTVTDQTEVEISAGDTLEISDKPF